MVENEFTKIQFRKRKVVCGDPQTCSGCRTCEVICSLRKEGAIDLSRSRIYVKSDPFTGSFFPIVCHQCADAPCYHACPANAIEIEPAHGTFFVNEENCTGCGACEEACPFQAIRLDREKQKALKCDLCQGDPQCFQWCPMNALGAITYGGEIPK